MKGKPRFFCEHCGKEVPRSAEKCSSCGRFFSSVRCPKCGFVGAQNLFSDGCPVCGYSAPPASNGKEWTDPEILSLRRVTVPAGALPAWVYLVTVIALIMVFAAAFAVIR
ncbi:MAG: hypothetical protein A2Z99_10380 [Treponema sp. GWB1_62_6]|nr:MAG: hypothetical protein A2Y36_10595 [Treponema sp. GWA1_62_8]OHE64924.1 MAG: hypothetical protein A2Z99_10380 [Treponema sp. GWB1_62_6]OHE67000.1 MAG: hypothetical protein A2001_08125 [Treponema sp. GWC1_61_84]OHE70912.1 MAG: hypothetical protein A2413_13320 [Treponema sp. RIFOXYC1_FULL_61_9]HCM27377.1 hypothetical protein [Treponema sp.]